MPDNPFSLKACPLCGGTAVELEEVRDGGRESGEYRCGCKKCGLWIITDIPVETDCEYSPWDRSLVTVYTTHYSPVFEAVRRWNTLPRKVNDDAGEVR